MVAARSGPGLWLTAAGSALAFATMFLPASSQQTLVRRDGATRWAGRDLESTDAARDPARLGGLWLADGALQLQPFMFGRGFASQILMPASMGSPPVAAGGPLGLTGARGAWLVLWGSFAYFILQPPFRAPGGLRDTFTGLASGEPGWVAAMDRGVASAAGPHGLALSIGLAVVFVAAGFGVFWPVTARAALALGALAGMAIWVLGENFGGLLTGQATDPNSGLLLILLAAACWPLSRRPAGAVSPDQGRARVLVPEESG